MRVNCDRFVTINYSLDLNQAQNANLQILGYTKPK